MNGRNNCLPSKLTAAKTWLNVQAYKHDRVIKPILRKETDVNLKWDGQLGIVAFDTTSLPFQAFAGKEKALTSIPPYWTNDFLFAWQKKFWL